MMLTGCCCLLGSGPALAQSRPPTPGLSVLQADTSLLRRTHFGQSFPFAAGVSMDLGLFRQVRRQSLRADTLLAGMQQRLDTANAQLVTASRRYENCQCARLDAEVADRHSRQALAKIYYDYQRLDKLTTQPWYTPLVRPLPLISLLVGLASGVYLGSR